jgi:hypothetical protein
MTSIASERDKNLNAAVQMKPESILQAEEVLVETAELVASLRKMVNNPQFSDVVFLCSDGKQVTASRMHLAARCDVMKSLLKNGMAESSLTEIKLPEVSSPVMLCVLEFLYTGNVLDNAPEDWKMGWEVISASRFFLMARLELIARKFMDLFVSAIANDKRKLAILLTEALKSKLNGEVTDDHLRDLARVLSLDWTEAGFVESLSEEAFHCLLVNTSSDPEHEDILSFRVYLRFRGVMQWWIYQSDLAHLSKETFMSSLVPDKAGVLQICGPTGSRQDKAECTEEGDVHKWDTLLTHKVPKRLLSDIDLRLIHPEVVAEVLEPLNILYGEILNAYRFHAVRRVVSSKTTEYEWGHDLSYRTFEQGHVIYCTGKTPGLAVLKEGMSRKVDGTQYEWEFVLDEDCHLYAELGFLMSLDPPFNTQLSDHNSATVFRFEGDTTERVRMHSSAKMVKAAQPFIPGSRVSFVLTFKGSYLVYSFSLNGQQTIDDSFWNGNDASRIYYPAVSFGKECRGRLRVELKRGFDILQNDKTLMIDRATCNT